MTDHHVRPPGPVTLERVRTRLAAHTPRPMSSRKYAWLNPGRPQPADAAVLCPLVPAAHGLEVVLTRRVDSLRNHAGQVSFPGGRADPSDRDRVATALREAHEEIGLPADAVTPLGCLNEHPTITGFRVTPVVGVVHRDVELVPNPDEVATVFQVPLEWLFDPRNVSVTQRDYNGRKFDIYRYEWRDEVIWGATATMIQDFRRIMEAI